MRSGISHEQLYSEYGLLLTITQVISALGILAFGTVETYMAYRFFSTHIEQSSGLAMIWIRVILYPLFTLIIAVILQIMKGLWK
ncbi:hypothetical protein B1400_1092 [Bifidobacterium italicum]|uniref:Uncharacterized protein n=1 Tax=Bifidobacterium italicum TaxID=1960968 RepID=A0A2A2EJX9_9BIFI|nr:hypothetical protein [Bifidobacterium italicum]PAU69206.1 hypothetical protein B1400_1092 [Bifidobacterium italicum]